MRFLIQLLGKLIARKLQRGSAKGAFAGVFLGVVLGIGLAYLFWGTRGVESVVAPAISMSMAFMIVGAVVGSALGPKPAIDEGTRSVRLTNFNRGLVPTFFFVLCAGFSCLLVYLPQKVRNPEPERYMKLGSAAGAALALFIQLRMTLWVEIGPSIILWRIWGARAYRTSEIAAIALRSASPDDDLLLGSMDGALGIRFTDGGSVQVPVPAHKTRKVIALLESMGKDVARDVKPPS